MGTKISLVSELRIRYQNTLLVENSSIGTLLYERGVMFWGVAGPGDALHHWSTWMLINE